MDVLRKSACSLKFTQLSRQNGRYAFKLRQRVYPSMGKVWGNVCGDKCAQGAWISVVLMTAQMTASCRNNRHPDACERALEVQIRIAKIKESRQRIAGIDDAAEAFS